MPGIVAITRLLLIAALATAGGVVALPDRAAADGPPGCILLGGKLLGGNITYAYAQLVKPGQPPGALPPAPNPFTGTPPSSAKVSFEYCLVVLSYSSTPANDPTPQNITIYIGLPLNSTDGGVTGSPAPFNFTTVEGNWNGAPRV